MQKVFSTRANRRCGQSIAAIGGHRRFLNSNHSGSPFIKVLLGDNSSIFLNVGNYLLTEFPFIENIRPLIGKEPEGVGQVFLNQLISAF
jgi:hypothetical protein